MVGRWQSCALPSEAREEWRCAPGGADDASRVQAYTSGYDRELNFIPHVSSAIARYDLSYTKPSLLAPFYGSNTMSVLAFMRFPAIPSEKWK
jgi:hypothetical protein